MRGTGGPCSCLGVSLLLKNQASLLLQDGGGSVDLGGVYSWEAAGWRQGGGAGFKSQLCQVPGSLLCDLGKLSNFSVFISLYIREQIIIVVTSSGCSKV